MLDFEQVFWNRNIQYIVGTDEVGRGSCAGPLVTAAVIFPPFYKNDLINDSKLLTTTKRLQLVEIIKKESLAFETFFVWPDEVDKLNPKVASVFGMEEVIKKLKIVPELVLTDFEKINTDIKQINLIKGDQKSISIAAASILAKVTRDNYMIEISKKYPQYGFEIHKGYCTKMHNENLKKFGICLEHRKSYKNVKKFM